MGRGALVPGRSPKWETAESGCPQPLFVAARALAELASDYFFFLKDSGSAAGSRTSILP